MSFGDESDERRVERYPIRGMDLLGNILDELDRKLPPDAVMVPTEWINRTIRPIEKVEVSLVMRPTPFELEQTFEGIDPPTIVRGSD